MCIGIVCQRVTGKLTGDDTKRTVAELSLRQINLDAPSSAFTDENEWCALYFLDKKVDCASVKSIALLFIDALKLSLSDT